MSDSVEGLKQRLVGAFVILTLAVIFLPMIFDKPHVIGQSKIVPIPPEPDFKTVTITQPTKPKYEVLEVDPADSKVKESSEIVKPERKPVAVTARPVASEPSKVVDAAEPAVTSSKPTQKNAPQPKTESKPKSSSSVSQLPVFQNVWMVQLGTFSNKSNAYNLRDRMRRDGFGAHTKVIESKGKRSIRVFSGPYVSKREANKLKKKLDAKYRVKSLVVFFKG